jgi:hypothetical protein
MARLIVLDSGPLGMIIRAPSKPHIVRCLTWLKTIQATGAVVIIAGGGWAIYQQIKKRRAESAEWLHRLFTVSLLTRTPKRSVGYWNLTTQEGYLRS